MKKNKEFVIQKDGLEFWFRYERLKKNNYNSYTLVLQHKVKGVKENPSNEDGYYFNAELDELNKTIVFYPFEKDGKKIGGVSLPDDIFEELVKLKNEQVKNIETAMNRLIDEIASGKKLITFVRSGVRYIPRIEDLPDELHEYRYKNHDSILRKAIEKATGDSFFSDPRDFLNERLPFIAHEAPKGAKNVLRDKEIQKRDGLNEKVITSFDMSLLDIIDVEEIKRQREERLKSEQEREKRKNSMVMDILEKKSFFSGEGREYYAKIRVTDKETGETKEFVCRNVFDVGFVINPAYSVTEGLKPGGISDGDYWLDYKKEKGWYKVRPLTETEKRMLKYLNEFAPVDKSIRL